MKPFHFLNKRFLILILVFTSIISDAEENKLYRNNTSIGTNPFDEIEVKIRFCLPRNIKYNLLKKKLQTNLSKNLISPHAYFFPKLIGKKEYRLRPENNTKIFYDYYLDSDNNALLNNNLSYRIRKRWNLNILNYLFRPFTRPTRCEIQTKTNFTTLDYLTTQCSETRFESIKHSISCDTDNLLKIAKTGKWNNKLISPSIVLKKQLELINLNSLTLDKTLVLKSKRDRFHINIVNPWGSGDNPDQVFIISIDRSKYKNKIYSNKKNIHCKNEDTVEIEIQIDRNVFNEILSIQKEKNIKPSLLDIIKLSNRAELVLKKDLNTISKLILDTLDGLGIKDFFFPPTSKYHFFYN